MPQKTNIKLHTTLQTEPAKGSWTYVVWDGVSDTFGTRRPVKVRGNIDGYEFENSFLPLKNGTHLMGVNQKTRKAIGKEAGDKVSVEIYGRV